MTKRRRQGWMLFLAGLLLLAGAWLLLKLLPGLDTTPWRAVPFLCLGVGCGLFGGGTGELLAVQAMKKHPELQKQNEIAERDERNVAIREKAAYSSWYWTLYLLWGAFFITLFLGSGFPTALVSVLIVLHCVFLMVNMNRWTKRM